MNAPPSSNIEPGGASPELTAEIASILATGLLRLHERSALTGDSGDVAAATDSERNCLEVSGD